MTKLLVLNEEAKEEQDADKIRVGKIGWLADFIENDGVGDHGYYLEEGKLIERPDSLNEVMNFNSNRNIKGEDYHAASQQEIAEFRAAEKVLARPQPRS